MKQSWRDSWKYKLAAYMTSQGISLLGSSIVSLAVIWYITLCKDSGGAVTLVTVTTFLPQALIMLFGGVLADRHSAKKIVMISDSLIALSTLILIFLFVIGADSIGWILFFNALRSFGTGIQLPASKSILPQIVPEKQLMKANSMFTGIWSTIQLVSPALGGLVMTYLEIQYVFFIDIITAMIGVLLLGTIPISKKEKQQSNENAKEELRKGFFYIKHSRPLRNSILLYTVFSFLVAAAYLNPLLASRNIGDEYRILSLVEIAFSIGALGLSIIMSIKEFRIARFKLVGLSSALFGITMILLLPTHNIVVFVVLMVMMGMGSPLYYTPLMTHIQENTEEAYMGRTFSYVDLFASLATPLGMSVFGPLANINIQISYFVPGVILILLGIYVAKKRW